MNQLIFEIMKKILIYLMFPVSLMFSSCMSSKTDSKRMAMEENKSKFAKNMCMDTKFAVCAADGNMLVAKLGELAQTNATSPAVKQFASSTMSDHSKMNSELKTLASGKNISLPTKLSDKSQKAYDWMAKKQGKDFDKAFMKCMSKHHKDDVCDYQKEAKKGKDADLQNWASGKVAMLKGHRDAAKKICKEL
jgi:putative membrane protein